VVALVACDAKDDVVSEGAIECGRRAQLERAGRSPNFAKLFENCEVPLSNPPQLPPDILQAVFRNTEVIDCAQFPDALYGVREPTADGTPGLPKSIVFCPELCERYKSWVVSETADDVCNLNAPNRAVTGSSIGTGNNGITGSGWPTGGFRGFPVMMSAGTGAGTAGVPADDDADSGTAGAPSAAGSGGGSGIGAGAAGTRP
jgi:hypothetical protein